MSSPTALAMPRRFVLLWGLLSACVGWGAGASSGFFFEGFRAPPTPEYWLVLVFFAGLFGFGQGLTQSYVLWTFGRRIPGWAIWLGLASILEAVGGALLRGVWGGVLLSMPDPGGMAFQILTWLAFRAQAACIEASAIACAAWGRRWPSTWALWLVGRLLLELPPILFESLQHGLGIFPDGLAEHGMRLLRHGWVGAGTAWLLIRFVLPAGSLPAPRFSGPAAEA